MKAKRIISMLLALALIAALFAGCGGDGKDQDQSSSSGSSESSQESSQDSSADSPDGGEAENTGKVDGGGYEVNYMYMVAQEGPNQNKVNQALNELAQKELNMKVNMLPMTWGTYSSQLSMMLAAGEPLDIFPAFSSNFSTYIESQYVVDMSQYLDDLKDAQQVLGEDFSCGYIGDFLIGLGQMKERGYPTGLVARKDIFDELDLKVEDFNVTVEDYSSFDQITQLFEKVKAAHPEMVCLDGTSIMALQTIDWFDNLGDNFGVLENYGQTTTITNWFESDQYRTFCEIGSEWFNKGYSSQDIAVNSDSGEIKMKAGNCFSFITAIKPNTDIEKKAQTGYDVVVIPLGGNCAKSTSAVTSAMLSVANSAEDPQKAVQFMNWTYKSQEFNDLINWGIQGEDWVLTEDNMAAYPEGVDASNVSYHNDMGYIYPNQFAGHAWEGNPSDIWEQYEKYNSEMMTSKAYGFTFDSTPVTMEETQLTSVYEQYYKDLAFGVVDIDAKLKEFNDALYAAGLQTVMDEKQKQLNEWLEKQ